MKHTHQPMGDQFMRDQAIRAEARREQIKQAMGTKYAHHPANHVRATTRTK